jgi:hypothetical protein
VGNRLVGGGIYQTDDGGRTWVKVAEADGVVTQLAVKDGVIYAGTPNGLVRYGDRTEVNFTFPLSLLHFLTSLNDAQLLVMALTLGLAGLMLLGREEWSPLANRPTSSS